MKRAIVMPNLTPPVTTAKAAIEYRERILEHYQGSDFDPLMTLYLTDETSPEDIRIAASETSVVACKLYPAGATTNSASGVTAMNKIKGALKAMEETGLHLLLHGEVTHDSIDIFDRESAFLEEELRPLIEEFPKLNVVLEHITTADAVEFVKNGPETLAATITAHHLSFNRNHMLAGRIRPHYYCLPILKRNTDQQALLDAATSGNPRFFLGTDSAPHTQSDKESSCGCAGSYTAPLSIELYATAFESVGKLDALEGFASHFGPDFYGLPRNKGTLTLVKSPWVVPETLPYLEDAVIIPLLAGQTMEWKAS